MNGVNTCVSRLLHSDAKEEPLAIHPVKNEPIDQHYRDAEHQRLKAGPKYPKDLVSEIDMQVVNDEVFP